jgi:hypothetical protein
MGVPARRNILVSLAFLFFHEDRMPRFHFEIVDGYTLSDPCGMELPTEQAAKKVAHEIAKQISVDVEDESFKDVVVKTEDGKEIYKAAINRIGTHSV